MAAILRGGDCGLNLGPKALGKAMRRGLFVYPHSMAKLLVVEDDELLQDALQAQLRYAQHQTEAAGDGASALAWLQRERFDAVVLDLGLPDMDGLDLLDALRADEPALPVLILTARDAIADRVAGLQRGADDYLTKPFEMSELIARIASLLRRSKLPAFSLSPAPVRDEGPRLDDSLPRVWLHGEPVELTQREWELLQLLVAQSGQVVGRDEVLAVWQAQGGGEALQSNALEVYVHRLRRKLQDSSWQIRNIRGLGYMLERTAADSV